VGGQVRTRSHIQRVDSVLLSREHRQTGDTGLFGELQGRKRLRSTSKIGLRPQDAHFMAEFHALQAFAKATAVRSRSSLCWLTMRATRCDLDKRDPPEMRGCHVSQLCWRRGDRTCACNCHRALSADPVARSPSDLRPHNSHAAGIARTTGTPAHVTFPAPWLSSQPYSVGTRHSRE